MDFEVCFETNPKKPEEFIGKFNFNDMYSFSYNFFKFFILLEFLCLKKFYNSPFLSHPLQVDF